MRIPSTTLRLGFALALAAAACTNDGTSPTTGALRVTVATTGGDPDLDGYIVTVDNSERTLTPNDTVVFAGLGTGAHAVRLRDVAVNCAVTGHPASGTDTTQIEIGQPSVSARDTTNVRIAVTCAASGVQITTATTGTDRDGDGYTVILDGSLRAVIDVNGSIALTRLSADSHRVALGEVAANCSVGAPHPRSVTVATGQVVSIPFAVSCTATTGAVTVTAGTTGIDADPSGYGVRIDAGPVRGLGTNGSTTFEGIGEGDHTVTLSDVADNCTVRDANPATVHVGIGAVARDTARTTFHVSCVSSIGAVKVAAVTTVTPGANVDPDGYTVFVDNVCDYYYGCYYQWEAPVLVNGTATIAGVPMGSHLVTLGGVARNCTIDGTSTRTVQVPPSDTARLTFAVMCQLTGNLQVSVATAGADLDPDGYVVRARSAALDTSAVLGSNATLTMSDLPPGDYSVQLAGVSANCDLTGANPRAVTVPSGGAATVAFDVACAAATPIALVSGVAGNDEIYTIKSNGAGVTRLTTNTTLDAEPAWSPDGARIAFRTERDGNAEIYVMNADGSSPVRVTSNAAADFEPAWSPDGARIAFVSARDGNAEIYVMNADGTNPVRLTNDPGYDADPAWSPDGSKIAFTRGSCDYSGCQGHIEVMNADGSAVVALTTGGLTDLQPAWSPDGAKIAFARRVCDYYSCDRDLIVMGANGSGATALVSGSDDQSDPAWSPDGRQIAFTATPCDYYYGCSTAVIELVRADGSNVIALTGSPGFNPAWRP